MNNYTEPGNYSLDDGSYLTSIKNAPKMNYAFDLNVGRALGDYTAQIFREYVTGNIAYRIYRADHWEDYRYFKSESDAFTTTLTNKTNVFATTKEEFFELNAKLKQGICYPIYLNGTAVSEITNGRYSVTGKGIFFAGTSPDIMLMLGSGDVILAGRFYPDQDPALYITKAEKVS